jgi:hypothetical protein
MDDLRSTRAFEPYVAIIEAAFEVTASLVVIHEGDECAEDPKEERGFRHVQASRLVVSGLGRVGARPPGRERIAGELALGKKPDGAASR